MVIIDKHHFSYIFKPHYVSESLPGSKEIMFPATLKAKNLKTATEEAKVERRARGRDRTWLNAKMALRGGPVAAPGTLSRGHFAWNSRTSDCWKAVGSLVIMTPFLMGELGATRGLSGNG